MDQIRRTSQTLLEYVLVGLDVLHLAHLTVTTLALQSPEVAFAKLQMYNLLLNGLLR